MSLAAVSLAIASVLVAPVAALNVPHRKLTPLQRGLAFYRGKTITFIAPTTAGSGSDLEARTVVQEMAAYLHATIDVVNLNGGNGIAGEDRLNGSTNNGLTIGFFNTGSTYGEVLYGLPGLNFNLEHVILLGGLPSTPPLIATQSSTSLTSFASLMHAPPSTLKVLGTPTGLASDEAGLLFTIFGIHPDYVFGYNGDPALFNGFTRGDGNLVSISPSNLRSEIAAHNVRPLVVLTNKNLPNGQSWTTPALGVPTVKQLLKQYPPKSAHDRALAGYFSTFAQLDNVMIGAPTRVSSDKVAALDAAVKFAVHSGYVRNAMNAKESAWGWISGAVEKAAYVNAIKHLSAIRNALGIHV